MLNADCGMRREPSGSNASRLNLIINGEPRELDGPLTIAGLLEVLKMPQRGLAVEVNQHIIPRSRLSEVLVADGDHFEIVSLVGGG
jgi:thiamine biosynthesis protein ThiS